MLPIGNEKVAARVRAFAAGKLPHAIMLEGERGTGRKMLARHIAETAVCEGENPPCAACRGCHLVAVGSHPDVITVVPDGKQIKVDQIRTIRQNAYLKPTIAERKVYIIEQADTMNESAQNAFLKVLEEPPAGVVFVLIAASAENMLETVRSRCITLSLTEPPHDEAVEHLSKITDHSFAEIDKALIEAKDNIGLALELLAGKKGDGFAALAEQLLMDINHGSAYEMLCRLKPYEKDRAAINSILDELMLRISKLLRDGCYTHIKEGLARARLIKMYDAVASLKKSAESNVNTMLLFANLCSTLKSL